MRVKVSNVDRVGLILDISHILVARGINIMSMEVRRNVVYLETEELSAELERQVTEELRGIGGIVGIGELELMPHEEKAAQLEAVLNTVNDGIVAVDRQGRVTQYNMAAQKIMKIPIECAIRQKLEKIFPWCSSLQESVKTGVHLNNREIFVEQTNSHYLVSSRPLLDRSGNIIGGVATLQDIRDVRKLYHKLTKQLSFSFDDILHTSRPMRQAITLAKAYAHGESTILIRGETGTGKELFARALHSASARAAQSFVPINCAAIPDALLESELFGYEEGAFTGAAKGGKHGIFELANDGTLFLDEIGEIPGHLQAKLLRVLQEQKIRRIGGQREFPINVRIIAATNRNLEQMIAEGNFREDLYYRLNVIPLFLPPLRERREDIVLLARHFLQQFAIKLHKTADSISDGALQILMRYDWPGNIRELENVMERAANLVDGLTVREEHVILNQATPAFPPLALDEQKTLEELMEDTERQILCRALSQYHSSRKLGQALGLSHTGVLKKLRKYGLSLGKFKPA